MRKKSISKLPLSILISAILLGVSGCSAIGNLTDTKSKIKYDNNHSVKILDFPPDLTSPEYDHEFVLPSNGVVNASTYQMGLNSNTDSRKKTSVLPASNKVRLISSGTSRWLEVREPASSLWPKFRSFWRSVGLSLKQDEPRVGFMETDWAENRAGIKKDFIRSFLGSIAGGLTDGGKRDKYRLRVEIKSASVTNVYLTHKGAHEIIDEVVRGWELQPADHDLEAEMLNRLKLHLQGNVKSKQVKSLGNNNLQASSIASLVTQEGNWLIQLHDSYQRSWITTGIMLDRMGLVVEDKTHSVGFYKVIYQGDGIQGAVKQGYFSRLLGGRRKALLVKGEEYQVYLQDAGKITKINIKDKQGKSLPPKLSKLVLARLKEEFDR